MRLKELSVLKKFCLAAVIALFSFSVSAQDVNQGAVPDNVVESFNGEFASASDVDWDSQDDGYEAEFSLNGKESEVLYDMSGNKKMVKTEIERTELPQAIQDKLDKEYASFEFSEFARVEKEGKTK